MLEYSFTRAALAAAVLFISAGAALASPALTIKASPLLAGPGGDYDKIMDLPAEMHVDIVWCGLHDSWCLIAEHNRMGWLPLASLNTHAKPKRLATTNPDDLGASGDDTPALGGKPNKSMTMATDTRSTPTPTITANPTVIKSILGN